MSVQGPLPWWCLQQEEARIREHSTQKALHELVLFCTDRMPAHIQHANTCEFWGPQLAPRGGSQANFCSAQSCVYSTLVWIASCGTHLAVSVTETLQCPANSCSSVMLMIVPAPPVAAAVSAAPVVPPHSASALQPLQAPCGGGGGGPSNNINNTMSTQGQLWHIVLTHSPLHWCAGSCSRSWRWQTDHSSHRTNTL